MDNWNITPIYNEHFKYSHTFIILMVFALPRTHLSMQTYNRNRNLKCTFAKKSIYRNDPLLFMGIFLCSFSLESITPHYIQISLFRLSMCITDMILYNLITISATRSLMSVKKLEKYFYLHHSFYRSFIELMFNGVVIQVK